MAIIKIQKLSQLFSAAALGAGSLLLAPSDGLAVESPAAEGLMRAQDALTAARGERGDSHLTADQKKIVRLLRDMRQTERGRAMTEKAAELGVIYAVHNYINGGAYYDSGTNIIALELVDDGKEPDGISIDLRDEGTFAVMERFLTGQMFHEHTHLYQGKVWNTLIPPAGLNSYDAFLWRMAYETQAIVTADIALREYDRSVNNGIVMDDEATLSDRFAASVFANYFHVRFHGKMGMRCDDGANMTRDAFVAAFGTIPGQKENFMESVFKDTDSIHRMFEKNTLIREVAESAGCLAPSSLPPEPAP